VCVEKIRGLHDDTDPRPEKGDIYDDTPKKIFTVLNPTQRRCHASILGYDIWIGYDCGGLSFVVYMDTLCPHVTGWGSDELITTSEDYQLFHTGCMGKRRPYTMCL